MAFSPFRLVGERKEDKRGHCLSRISLLLQPDPRASSPLTLGGVFSLSLPQIYFKKKKKKKHSIPPKSNRFHR